MLNGLDVSSKALGVGHAPRRGHFHLDMAQGRGQFTRRGSKARGPGAVGAAHCLRIRIRLDSFAGRVGPIFVNEFSSSGFFCSKYYSCCLDHTPN